MASSSVAVSPTSQPDWRKMNKQALRDALASRGLDTNGLRPSLIQRLESSAKAVAAPETLAVVANGTTDSTREVSSRKESFDQVDAQAQNETQTPATEVTTSQESKVPQEPPESMAIAPKSYTGQAKLPAENGKSEHNLLITSNLTDLERKRLRAERFGMGLQVSEQEKLALRAERFSGAEGKKPSNAGESEFERRKQRAARFGIVDEESRKKARQERFAPAIEPEKSSEAEKRKARAARFSKAAE